MDGGHRLWPLPGSPTHLLGQREMTNLRDIRGAQRWAAREERNNPVALLGVKHIRPHILATNIHPKIMITILVCHSPYQTAGYLIDENSRQGYLQATAHNDFSIYSCHMRRLLTQDFLYSEVTNIENVVIFATYSSQCTGYFEMCGKPRVKVYLGM